ncbi:MAG: N-acetylneuraminate synthase, partial [bacterium]|nr:N-acetylneuraminate synthase [bacterium]
DLPVGYSDHTPGVEVAWAAVALGARIIEKHLTLDRTAPGPDHRASLEPCEFAQLTAGIRRVESALGDGVKQARASEADVLAAARRSLVATADLAAGTVLRREHLALKRPGTGIPPAELETVLGERLERGMSADELLTRAHLGSNGGG